MSAFYNTYRFVKCEKIIVEILQHVPHLYFLKLAAIPHLLAPINSKDMEIQAHLYKFALVLLQTF